MAAEPEAKAMASVPPSNWARGRLQGLAVRIVAAAIDVAPPVLAIRVTLKRGGKLDGRHQGSGGRVASGAGVNQLSVKVHCLGYTVERSHKF